MVVHGNSDGTLRFKKNKNHQELKNEIVKKESQYKYVGIWNFI